ncbi:hypothetical protein V1478_000059 [Vespula squamosa]|uniref:Uncharacterized protein n=1 Tax=Vespula squamosa TaxID=30214 RepID=A0ABD2C939_VESSQ
MNRRDRRDRRDNAKDGSGVKGRTEQILRGVMDPKEGKERSIGRMGAVDKTRNRETVEREKEQWEWQEEWRKKEKIEASRKNIIIKGKRFEEGELRGEVEKFLENRLEVKANICFWNVVELSNKGKEVWEYLEEFDVMGLMDTRLDQKGWNELERKLAKKSRWTAEPAKREHRRGRWKNIDSQIDDNKISSSDEEEKGDTWTRLEQVSEK